MAHTVFFLGSHPVLSAAEIVAWAERVGLRPRWDLSRLPAALIGEADFSPPTEIQRQLGGTTMVGELRATFPTLPTPVEILSAVPELQEPRQGKLLIGLSALALHPSGARGTGLPVPANTHLPAPTRAPRKSDFPAESKLRAAPLALHVRELALALKRAIGMKGTRVVFPPSRRPDLSTAQLLHNRLPRDGTAIFFLVAPQRVDLVTIDAIQDIEAYAQRDRGRPHADPAAGMLPPKVAQMLINLSLVPSGGTVCDPFCGVGTIPIEAALLGLRVIASDRSETQVERTKVNLTWLAERFPPPPGVSALAPHVFVHDVTRGPFPLPPDSVDAIVTEGWLGPARTTPPLPREADAIFSRASELLQNLLSAGKVVLRERGSVVVVVPAFRRKKEVLRFPLEQLRERGFLRESLVPDEWKQHPLFRDAARGTLLYGRPDALVLREIVRFRKRW